MISRYPHTQSTVSFSFLALVALMLLSGMVVHAQAAGPEKDPDHPWEVQAGIGLDYDSNILQYSDKYIELFLARKDEGRFHITTYDDAIVKSSLRCSRSLVLIGGLESIVTAGLHHEAYTHSPIKNWLSTNVSLRQELIGSSSLFLSYSYTPQLYLRHYRDDDWVSAYGYTPQTFQPYEYAKDGFSSWIQNTFFGATRVRASYGYQRVFLNKHFTEYDSKNILWGVELSQPLHKKVGISFGYRFITSSAKGYDSTGENKSFTDDNDASYEADNYSAGVEWRLPKIFECQSSLAVEVQYQHAFFSSKRPVDLDPLHAGRQDHVYRVAATYSIQVLEDVQLVGSYGWSQRRSKTSVPLNQQEMSDEKDYRQYEIGLEANYVLRF